MHLEVPRFTGEDPYDWIFKIEEYFAYQQISGDQRLQIVSFHLDDKALAWFQWLKTNNLLSTWSEFIQKVKFRFGSSHFEDPEGKLAKLLQQRTIESGDGNVRVPLDLFIYLRPQSGNSARTTIISATHLGGDIFVCSSL
ncbi:hypothetical protein C2S52_015709 [Perilla frutescens var. hirtella]|nr:hypothetical protein C2S52_015709 [Perilla frutescens var. hirtella]